MRQSPLPFLSPYLFLFSIIYDKFFLIINTFSDRFLIIIFLISTYCKDWHTSYSWAYRPSTLPSYRLSLQFLASHLFPFEPVNQRSNPSWLYITVFPALAGSLQVMMCPETAITFTCFLRFRNQAKFLPAFFRQLAELPSIKASSSKALWFYRVCNKSVELNFPLTLIRQDSKIQCLPALCGRAKAPYYLPNSNIKCRQ